MSPSSSTEAEMEKTLWAVTVWLSLVPPWEVSQGQSSVHVALGPASPDMSA